MPSSRLTANQIGAALQFKREVMFMDDFEQTIPYTITGTGADFAAAIETGSVYIGTKGMLMSTKLTTPAADDYVSLAKKICFGLSGRVVIRVRIGIVTIAHLKDFQVFISYCATTTGFKGGLKYDATVPDLKYYNSTGGWTGIAGTAYNFEDDAWITMEFQIDMGTARYLPVTFGGHLFDFAGPYMKNMGAVNKRQMTIEFIATAAGANKAYLRLDSLYVGELINI